MRITEDDLLYFFSAKERFEHKKNLFFDYLKKMLLGLFLVFIVFLIVNFSAYYNKIAFWYKTEFGPAAPTTTEEETVTQPVEEKKILKVYVPKMTENEIKIPALDLTAPITWRVNNIGSEVSKALENGVIHLNGTVFPGEIGNVFITGHSSNFVWAKGNYNSIFALLDKLVIGDKVYIKYNSQVYIYEIFDKTIITPSQTSVLDQTEDSRLTLATCWPVGTNLQRLVIFAKQTYPDPKKNKESNKTYKIDKMPATR